MSYTAPLGIAVDFVFSGETYTAPPGNAVDFSFVIDAEGSGACQIPISATGLGAFLVSGSASATVLAAYATDIPWRSGTGRATLVFEATGEGDLLLFGIAEGEIGVAAAGSGYAPVSGELIRELRLTGYATGSAAVGNGVGAIQISATAFGASQPLGVGSAANFVGATASGNIGRTGHGQAQIGISGSGWAVSIIGQGAAAYLIAATGIGSAGRSGTAMAQLRVSGRASGAHGISGQASTALLNAYSSGTVLDYISGSGAAVLLRGYGIGTHQKITRQVASVSVLSKQNQLVVHHV